MFVQVIDGRTAQPDALREGLERWLRDLAPGATGWLGGTAGVTADGRAISLARFATEEDARRNSDRPEQGAWWSDLMAHLEGQPRVVESTDVTVRMAGDPDDAGFVQIIRGRSSDPARMKELMGSTPEDFASFRPDILGDLTLVSGDELIAVLYFTSEAEARRNEKKQPPQEMQAAMDEAMKLAVGEPEWFDLPQPTLLSPSST